MKWEPKATGGFSMLEMVLTITILSVVAGLGVQFIRDVFNAYLTGQALTPMVNEGQLAMERLIRELQGATCLTLSQPGGADTLTFTNFDGAVLSFSQSGQTILYSSSLGGVDKVLVEGVEAASLTFQPTDCMTGVPPGVVQIHFAMEATLPSGDVVSVPLETSVFIRN
ncbi:MAG: prepilin-type N-terminal cleavage/methylation domain-containing protein [Magnetococcales bacterium]|nr:prepilin-type N-terminal cleavage/methylation domain-containing protein [Magnetococcales bacterium]